jgi:hypothetical protein
MARREERLLRIGAWLLAIARKAMPPQLDDAPILKGERRSASAPRQLTFEF